MRNKLSKYIRHSIRNKEAELYSWYEYNSDELVAQVLVANIDCQNWIQSLFVSPKYRGKGLSYALLDFATILGGNRLAVRKTNTALNIYKKYGFIIFDENDEFYFMKLSEKELQEEGKDE